MSKGNSGLFSGTSGEGRALIDEVIANGDKITSANVIKIGRDPSGRIVWIEKGNSSAGFQHIIERHGNEFHGKGISDDELPEYIMRAVCKGKAVGTQGSRNPRTVYEFTYHGETHRIAVQVSKNGFIVSANPKKKEGL